MAINSGEEGDIEMGNYYGPEKTIESSLVPKEKTQHGHAKNHAEEELIGDDKLAEETLKLKAPMIHRISFIVTGTAELFVWNAILAILYDIRDKVYPDYPSMTDTLNAANNLTNIVSAIICVYTGAMNQLIVMASGFTLAILCIALAMITQWSPGLQGVIWYHVVSSISGIACGFFQAGTFGLAAALPVPCVGYCSTGQGVSGLVTWVMWMIISNTSLDVKQSMWVLMASGTFVSVFSTLVYVVLIRKPEVAKRVDVVQTALREEARNPNAPSYRFLFMQCWRHVFTIFWNFLVTLVIFPNIGPLAWNAGDFTNAIMGAFQVGDLVGRYIPNLLPMIVLRPIPLFWVVIGRTLLVPLALCAYFLTDNVFWNSRALQMILMAILAVSNGWLASCVFINTPFVIKSEEWRSRVSSMVIVGLLVGIGCGLWLARLFTAVTS